MPIEQLHIQQFSHFELLAKQVVEGFITGMHQSPFHGFSVEFAEHKLYNKGDSTRHIDWKLFARSEKLFLKRYEEETNLRCNIVIDNSSSMYYPKNKSNTSLTDLNKIGFASYTAAAIIYLLQKQADAFGITLFSNDIEQRTPIKSTVAHQQMVFDILDKCMRTDTLNKTTNLAKSLHAIAATQHKRSLIVIVSDMLYGDDELQNILNALQHMRHQKHEILLIHVLDHATELRFEFDATPHHFIDMETGVEVKCTPHQFKQQYITRMQAQALAIKEKCLGYKVDYIAADNAQAFNEVLAAFLIRRTKQ
jgi:uncharacterized protein (DUF58 family)